MINNILTRFPAIITLTLLTFCATGLSHHAIAQDDIRYVSDVLFVPLRSGQGNEFRIVNAGLKSGTPLTFIEMGESGNWTKVRTNGGIEGWIRSQYIIEDKPSALKLNQALSQLASVKKTLQQLTSENKKLKQTNTELSKKANAESKARATMSTELDSIKTLSAGAINLERRYTELLQKHQIIQTDFDVLKAENEQLANDNRVTFMLYGVGILLLGILIAFILPALKPNKRHSDWR